MSGVLTPPPSAATIPFKQVPSEYQLPGSYTEIEPSYGNLGVLAWPARALIVGQALTGSPGVLGAPVQVTRVADATARWGAGSMVERMVAAFMKANPYVPLDVIAVADAAGATKAAGSFALGGTWTSGGTLALYIASVRVAVGVQASDTAATVAANAIAAINAAVPGQLALPAVASAGTPSTTITLTAVNGGLAGNDIRLEVSADAGDLLPAGMTCAVTPMTGGATNPAIGPVINAITGIWYTDIAMPWQDTANLSAFATELDTRYGAMVTEDGHGYVVLTGTFAQCQSTKASVNCKEISFLGMTNPPSTPWEMAASLAGVASFALTNDPARQLGDLALPGMVGPRPADRWTSEEKELALEGGISPVHMLSDGTVVLTRVVTSYLTNAEGVPDQSWHDIMTPKVMSRVRWDWDNYRKLIYPSNKLADNGSIAAEYDSTVATPRRLAASWATRYRVYEQAGWLESDALATQGVFVRNASDPNRVDSTRPMQIIGNLMIDASVLQFQL
jgi:phage tail sheath gpL-like